MKHFQTIKTKGSEMSQKIRTAAEQWRHIIYIVLFAASCVSFSWKAITWFDKREIYDSMRDRQDVKRDSVLTRLVEDQKITSLMLNSLWTWRDAIEPEHLELLKKAEIFPKRMYKGEAIIPNSAMKPFPQ
jgi:hypothetical protein